MLSTEFHPGSLEDLSGRQPLTIIAVDAAEPKKDDHDLLLLRELLPHDESMVLATLGLPERDLLVLGPLDLFLLIQVSMVNLSLQEFLQCILKDPLPLSEWPSSLRCPPAISSSLRFLLLVTMAEELS